MARILYSTTTNVPTPIEKSKVAISAMERMHRAAQFNTPSEIRKIEQEEAQWEKAP